MRVRLLAAALALVLFPAACGPKVHVDDSPYDLDDPRAGASIDEPKPIAYAALPDAPPPTTGAVARTGTITRSALDAILDAGPGVLLQHLEVSAETDDDKLLGWRIVAFDPQHKDFGAVDLAIGDVVVAINGSAVAKPDELATLWDTLRTADAIVVDVRRGDAKFQIDWTITRPASAPTPAPTPSP